MKYQVSFCTKTWYLNMWKKHVIFTCENITVAKATSYIVPFTPKNYSSEMVWYFIGVYIINRTLHGHLDIRNFSSRIEKIFHTFSALTREIFFITRREISYLGTAMWYPLSPHAHAQTLVNRWGPRTKISALINSQTDLTRGLVSSVAQALKKIKMLIFYKPAGTEDSFLGAPSL